MSSHGSSLRLTSTSALVRLSFWVPAAQMAEFEAAYESRLAPILKKHGLVESAERGRPTAEGVFSRLFEVEGPVAISARERVFHRDPAWQEALRSLGVSFGTADPGGLLRYRFGIYRTPAGPGNAVEAGPGSRQGPWQRFGVADGLPPVTVSALAWDQQGRLWLGTGRMRIDEEEGVGVACYDGAQFVAFTTADGLAGNTVLSIAADGRGDLWFATWGGGVSRYDGQTFTTFTVEDGLADNRVFSMLADRQGHLWFGTFGGVSRYDGERFTPFTTQDGLAHNQVSSVLEDRQGDLWFGTDGGGVSRYDGERFTPFTTQDGLAHNQVSSVLEDRQGDLWFGTDGGGVSRYDGERFTPFTTQDGLASNYVISIMEDPQGHIWFGTIGGLSRYDGKTWTAFTTADGLKSNIACGVVEDREGGLWFGALGGGLSRYDDQHILNLTTRDGLVDNQLLRIFEDSRGQLWFCSWAGKGLSRYGGKAWTTFTTEDGLPANGAASVLEDHQGRLWFGFGAYGGGVSRYDGERFTTLTTQDGLTHNQVGSILEDRQGRLWFGTWGGGVSRYDGQQFTTLTAQDGLADDHVIPILEDRQGYLWFGTRAGGVSRYDGKQFTTFTIAEGLTHNHVFSIMEDRQGHLWFGTWGGGVSQYDGKRFKTFTTAEGLTNNRVTSILEDHQGHLWFGTWGGGVSCYDGLMFQRLLEEDGLAQDVVQGLMQARNGDIWIATEGGATRYRPSRTLPSVRLMEVIADRRYGPVEEVQIPASQEFVIFQFQGRSFTTRPDGMAYVYRLLGREEEWKPCYARQVEYQDLPLGEYTFQVRAVDRDLNYSEPVEVRLKVIPDPRDQRIDELEQRVRERTMELEEKNQSLGEANAALQVEAALERVRAKALGMQQSEDLGQAAAAVFEELRKLGLRLWRCGFNIIDEGSAPPVAQMWLTTAEGKAIQTAGKIPLVGHPAWEALYAAWKRKEAHYSMELAGEDLVAFTRYNIEHMDRVMRDWRSRPAEALPQRLVYCDAFFPHGFLGLALLEPLSAEELSVVQRFAGVFSLAYTRFLDLQQAEARTRQTARQTVVDRLRAEIASMRQSADLERITPLLWRELTELGVPFSRCGVIVVDEQTQLVRYYLTNPQGVSLGLLQLGFDSHPHVRRIVDRWQVKEVHIEQWDQQEFLRWTDFLQGQGQIERERYLDRGVPPEALVVHHVPFVQGTLYVGSAASLSTEDIDLMKALASAFSIAYARYLDFQQLEEKNRQVEQASQYKSQFLSRMSHDLRTPMNAILGYTRILLRKAKDTLDERQYKNLENIQLSADHLLALINDILDLNRIEAGRVDLRPEPVDLRQLVAQCATSVESLLKPGVELRQEIAEVAPFYTDPDRLRRVLMNLLSNAVKFTSQGSITVSVQAVEGWVELSVADTGIGIPAEDLPHIFEEFRQVERRGIKAEGTGLGLEIAKRSVELLGGSIAVESQVGKGTRFTLKIADYKS